MDELGYLDDPADRLGMLDAQALRAARVIVDIGMHLELDDPRGQPPRLGAASTPGETWTPELGLEFMRPHCRMDDETLRFEVNRYLGWPGQAPSYKVGERLWLEARADAQARQGADFDLKAFHRAALDLGSLGLDPLRTRRWSGCDARCVLASQSPARLATLRSAGLDPTSSCRGVDESEVTDLPPAELALAARRLKAPAVAARDDVPAGALVLGCDSVLELDGEAHGKPGDAAEARRRWRRCAAARACCTPGTASRHRPPAGSPRPRGRPTVHFADVERRRDRGVRRHRRAAARRRARSPSTGSAAPTSRGIEGDPHNVVGISLPLLRELVAELGHAWQDLWSTTR